MKANSEPQGSLFKHILNLLCGLTSTTFLHWTTLLFLKYKGHLGQHRLIRVSPFQWEAPWSPAYQSQICHNMLPVNRSPDLVGPRTAVWVLGIKARSCGRESGAHWSHLSRPYILRLKEPFFRTLWAHALEHWRTKVLVWRKLLYDRHKYSAYLSPSRASF